MIRVISSTLLYFRKSPITWFCLIAFGILGSVQSFGAWCLSNIGVISMESLIKIIQFPDFIINYVLQSNLVFGIPLFIFLICVAYGSEYEWGTLNWGIQLGILRSEVFLGKLIAFVIVASLGCLINTFLGCIFGIFVNSWIGLPFQMEMISQNAGGIIIVWGLTILSYFSCASLILFIITISRSPMFSLAAGYVLYLLEYLVFYVLKPGLGPWDVIRSIGLFTNIFQSVSPLENSMFSLKFPILLIIFHGVLWTFLSLKIFNKQDMRT